MTTTEIKEPIVPSQPTQTPVVPPTSYATYPGAFYIDPETKETHRAVPNKFQDSGSFVSKSSIHGLGCYAHHDIKAGELIEECSAIITDSTTKHNKDWVITQYLFTWPCENEDPICKEHGPTYFIPTGNALLYNHSDTPNGYWIYDKSMKRIFFSALRDIKANEELTWYYGHGYAHKLRAMKSEPKKTGGCSACEKKKRELEEQGKLQKALNISPTTDDRLLKLIESKNKESATLSNEHVEFRSMVVPEKKLDDNIQNG